MMSITPAHMRVLRFVQGWIETFGYAPTFTEMSYWLGMNRSSVHQHLFALTERGFVRRMFYRKQAIEVVQKLDLPRAPDGAPLFVVPIKKSQSQQHVFLS